jgi:hypothetical protein
MRRFCHQQLPIAIRNHGKTATGEHYGERFNLHTGITQGIVFGNRAA